MAQAPRWTLFTYYLVDSIGTHDMMAPCETCIMPSAQKQQESMNSRSLQIARTTSPGSRASGN